MVCKQARPPPPPPPMRGPPRRRRMRATAGGRIRRRGGQSVENSRRGEGVEGGGGVAVATVSRTPAPPPTVRARRVLPRENDWVTRNRVGPRGCVGSPPPRRPESDSRACGDAALGGRLPRGGGVPSALPRVIRSRRGLATHAASCNVDTLCAGCRPNPPPGWPRRLVGVAAALVVGTGVGSDGRVWPAGRGPRARRLGRWVPVSVGRAGPQMSMWPEWAGPRRRQWAPTGAVWGCATSGGRFQLASHPPPSCVGPGLTGPRDEGPSGSLPTVAFFGAGRVPTEAGTGVPTRG